MKRLKVYISLLFIAIGVARIIDWFVFWENNKQLAVSNFAALKVKYVARVPASTQPLFAGYPEPATVISIALFLVSGSILIREKGLLLRILAVLSFVLAFWNLFSLM